MELTAPMTPRILPLLDDRNRAFWTGGKNGELLLERCARCERWQHPPVGRCEACEGEVVHAPVSGSGTVFTYTVNVHPFHPDVPPPYVIALVELLEQPGLRMVANIVGAEEPQLRIGLPVQVAFEHAGEHYVPIFTPVDD